MNKIDKKKEFLKSLSDNLGVISIALSETDIPHEKLKEWLQEDDFLEELINIKEATGDFVEEQLLKKIREGDTQAIIFYCRTILKMRGYFEGK